MGGSLRLTPGARKFLNTGRAPNKNQYTLLVLEFGAPFGSVRAVTWQWAEAPPPRPSRPLYARFGTSCSEIKLDVAIEARKEICDG